MDTLRAVVQRNLEGALVHTTSRIERAVADRDEDAWLAAIHEWNRLATVAEAYGLELPREEED